MNIDIPVPDGLEPIALKPYKSLPWSSAPNYDMALYFEDTPNRVLVVHRRELSNGKYQYLNAGLIEIIDREAYNAYLQEGIIEAMANECSAYTMAGKKNQRLMMQNLHMLLRYVKQEHLDIINEEMKEYGISETVKPIEDSEETDEPVNDSDDLYMVVAARGDSNLNYVGEYDPAFFELVRTMLKQRFELIRRKHFPKSKRAREDSNSRPTG